MAAVLVGADPWFINQRLSSVEARAPWAAVFGHNPSGPVPEGGVVQIAVGRLAVTATTPSASMALSVASGPCVIPRANQHVYVCGLTAAGTVDVPAADSVNPRIDTVIARVRDPDLGDAAGPTGATGFAIEIVTGTPAAVPAVPDLSAIPACIPLRDYRVPAGATSITSADLLTDRRYYTRAIGGVRYSGGAESRTGSYPWDLRVSAGGQFDGWDDSAAAWVPLLTSRSPNTYTPTWTMDNLGTGSASAGVYNKTGRMVDFEAVLVAGTGVSLGAGAVTFTLPFPTANRTGTAASLMAWWRGAFIYSASLWRSVDIVIGNNGTTGTVFARNTTDGFVNPGVAPTPYTFAAGNSITVSGRYWAAA
jgi:hypothetical protein